MGDPARPDLTDIVRRLLGMDRSAFERAIEGAGDLSRFRALEGQITALRQAARENINKLAHDQTIPIAHQNYTALQPLREKLIAGVAPREALVHGLVRRAGLISLWRELAPLGDASFPAADEAKLLDRAGKVAGLTVEEAAAIPEFGHGNPPADGLSRDIWHFRACRLIDAYNETVRSAMNAGEYDNFKRVNAYRECLGILPLELDPRLVKSARGHSKEMADLHYFSHESPVAANKTFVDRIRTAGYDSPRGENIAMGNASGEQTFWMWFDSPGHHQNMADPTSIALGVGEIGVYWTQNFGTGSRLMLMAADKRQAVFAAAR